MRTVVFAVPPDRYRCQRPHGTALHARIPIPAADNRPRAAPEGWLCACSPPHIAYRWKRRFLYLEMRRSRRETVRGPGFSPSTQERQDGGGNFECRISNFEFEDH